MRFLKFLHIIRMKMTLNIVDYCFHKLVVIRNSKRRKVRARERETEKLANTQLSLANWTLLLQWVHVEFGAHRNRFDFDRVQRELEQVHDAYTLHCIRIIIQCTFNAMMLSLMFNELYITACGRQFVASKKCSSLETCSYLSLWFS